MRVESHYKIFLLILLFLLNSPDSLLPLYGSPLPSPVWHQCLMGWIRSQYSPVWLRLHGYSRGWADSTAAGYVSREPCAAEIRFPAPAHTQRCLVFVGNTESYKCVKFCGYVNLLSLLRITVSNLLYHCKELLSCSNMFPQHTRCLHRGGINLFVRVHPPWLAKPNFKLIQLNTQETRFKRGLNSCFNWEESPFPHLAGRGVERLGIVPRRLCPGQRSEPSQEVGEPCSALPAPLCTRKGRECSSCIRPVRLATGGPWSTEQNKFPQP